jgi:beta-lactam-binding protein with PASTA domain
MATKKKNSSTKKAIKPVEEKEVIKEEKVLLDKTEDIIELTEGKKEERPKVIKKHPIVNLFSIIVLIISLVSFVFIILNKDSSIITLISSLLLTIFVICFSVVSITYKRNNKSLILIGCLLLMGYFGLNMFNPSSINIGGVPNFTNKSVTEVMKWASKNSISINQEYEYSDMISEYKVISQDVKSGTSLAKVKELTVSISEGANPSKEIIVPSMIGWDTERVLKFIKDNYLSNVNVEFIQSDMAKDTVINQSASGNLKRDDEINLTFSYGEELYTGEFSLIDFSDKSRFEVEFYMKQHQLNYKFEEEFSSKVKRGLAIKQSIKAGDKVSANGNEIVVTISKGPEIKVPDLKKMDMTSITEWAIKNKVKLNFSDSYDDTVKKNGIISTSVNTGDIIEQGSIIKVVLSRGNLKMPSIESIEEFYEWANKYNIKYEEQHEFSDSVPAGKVISYSYKTGSIIKNGDSIKVIISDGVKKSVPSVVGLSKTNACNKLENNGLNCSVSYRNSTETKDKVLSQSISAGSEVSNGTTVVISVSNGKAPSSNTGGNTTQPRVDPTPTPQPDPTPTPTCKNVTVWIDGSHMVPGDAQGTCNAIKSAYSELKFTCSYVSYGEYVGYLVNQESIDGGTFSTCDTITLKIRNQ